MRFKNPQVLFSIFLFLFLNVSFVIAQDIYPPHLLYGTVIYNGQPAPDGVSVVAKIDRSEKSTTTSGGYFGYNPIFYVEGSAEDEIHFFVNNIDTGVTVDFCNSCFNDCGRYDDNRPPLVLSVTGPAITTTTTPGVTTTTPGGGGGGTTTSTTISPTTIIVTQTTIQGCQEKWSCTDWSKCENNAQRRTCTDENNCGTDLYKPFESQPCVTEETKGESSLITGFVSLLSTPTIIGSIIVIILVVIGLLYFFVIRKRTV